MSSSVSARRQALYHLLHDAPSLSAKLSGDRVYAGVAPQKSPLPFIVLTDPAESDLAHFGTIRKSGTEAIQIYAKTALEVLDIYVSMEELLNRKKPPLQGHTMLTGRLRLVNSFVDPSGAHHGVAEYSVITQTA